MSDSSELSEPYQDSGSEFLPDSSDEDDDNFTSSSESDGEIEPIVWDEFSLIADPFAVSTYFVLDLFLNFCLVYFRTKGQPH